MQPRDLKEVDELRSAKPTLSAGDAKAFRRHVDAGRKAEKNNDLPLAAKEYHAATLQASGFPQPDERYAASRQDWGRIMFLQRKYFLAMLHWERVLVLREQLQGSNHVAVGRLLWDLGAAYAFLQKYAQAEAAHHRALEIFRTKLGAFHPAVGISLGSQAGVYAMQRKYQEAESMYHQALEILEARQSRTSFSDWGLTETIYRPLYVEVANVLNDLALLYEKQGRSLEAETTQRRALKLYEREAGKNTEGTALALHNLGELLAKQGNYKEAESLLKRSLSIREKLRGPDHPLVLDSLRSLISLYQRSGNPAGAERYEQQAKRILLRNRVPR